MSEKLKPCPFCGGEAKIDRRCNEVQNFWDFRVVCNKCSVKTNWYGTKAEAIKARNRRQG